MMQLILIIIAQTILMVGLVSGVQFIKKRFADKWFKQINGLDFLPVLSLIYVIMLSLFSDKWLLLFGYLLVWAVVVLIVTLVKIFGNHPVTRTKLLKVNWRISDLLTPIMWIVVVGLTI
ncbi:DUF3397 family protein [Lentilactobacillus senioris]|uniref:DUF3397 family protein n=1 Tax=Lentilactobacillus senioris TaxID=931534 RepID=UPI0022823D27|nr:DUF3397 family protein [Lentilactobacillus senioris]MCY9807602.1 DUF3397 family protein [Lentilactobacillus senioris]